MTTSTTSTHTLRNAAGEPLCNGKMISVGSGPFQTLHCLLCGHEELTYTVHRRVEIEGQPKSNQEWQERFNAVSERMKEAKGTLRMLLLTEAVPARHRYEIETRVQMMNEALNGLEMIQRDFGTLIQTMGSPLQETLNGLAHLQNELGSRLVARKGGQNQTESKTDEIGVSNDETQLVPAVSVPANNDETPKENATSSATEEEDEEAVHVTIYTRAVSA